jgi:HEPN domain-containing protein
MTAEVARALLARARDDAEAVRATLAIGEVTDAIVAFHAQQAVEKSLKAVLADNGVEFPFTHDLEGLMELCGSHAIEVPQLLVDSAGQLSPYAVHLRYGADPPSLVDRQTAQDLAQTAVTWALSRG